MVEPGSSTPHTDTSEKVGRRPGPAAPRAQRSHASQKKQKNKPIGNTNEQRNGGNRATPGQAPAKTHPSNSKHGKTASKKKKKKKAPKPPPQRIVCIAEPTLAESIDRALAAGTGRHPRDLEDLPKEHINALPIVPYPTTKRPVVVVDGAAAADAAVAAIRAALAAQPPRQGAYRYLGFDTKTRPKFQPGGDPHPPAVLQLATPDTAYLFRLVVQGAGGSAMTDALRRLLADPGVVKVGVGVHHDVRDLQRAYGADCGGDGATYLDLGPLARRRWPHLRRPGLRNLTATLLGWRLSKAQQTKNWEMATLTPAMQAYAAADAWIALDLLAAIVG